MWEQVCTRCLTFLMTGSESELTTCLLELLIFELQRLLFSSRNGRWDLFCLFKNVFSLMSGKRTFPYVSNQWHWSCFWLKTAEIWWKGFCVFQPIFHPYLSTFKLIFPLKLKVCSWCWKQPLCHNPKRQKRQQSISNRDCRKPKSYICLVYQSDRFL